jgi:hypothetical protein
VEASTDGIVRLEGACSKTPVGQAHYSNLAIDTALTLRAVFKLVGFFILFAGQEKSPFRSSTCEESATRCGSRNGAAIAKMAKLAVQQIEAAFTASRDGGDAYSAAIFEAQLPKARTLAEKLA